MGFAQEAKTARSIRKCRRVGFSLRKTAFYGGQHSRPRRQKWVGPAEGAGAVGTQKMHASDADRHRSIPLVRGSVAKATGRRIEDAMRWHRRPLPFWEGPFCDQFLEFQGVLPCFCRIPQGCCLAFVEYLRGVALKKHENVCRPFFVNFVPKVSILGPFLGPPMEENGSPKVGIYKICKKQFVSPRKKEEGPRSIRKCRFYL